MIENVVLGGGIAGIAAAYETKRGGKEATIFEGSDRTGGLLDNFTIEGFRFDTAVHLSFATEREVREIFDRSRYYAHQPEAVNWDSTLWLKHPVQNNMHPLPIEERVELVAGLAEAANVEVKNYRDWLVHQYGEPIAARWPMVYTEKYWTVPAEALGVEWIGQRIRRADLREVLKGAFTDDTENVYYAKEMRYPEEGGYKSFIAPMIAEVDIRTGYRVTNIDPANKSLTFSNSSRETYGNIVSSLPLPALVKLIKDCPEQILKDAETLFATEIDLISIGFNKPRVSPTLWFYIYDRDILAARAYAPDWKSPSNVPEGCSSLQFEIYSSRAKPQTMSVEQLKRNTIDGVKKMGLANDEDIIFVHHHHLKYGNVVFDLGMEERRDRVRRWVESKGIQVAGRFGEWAYLWSNQSMLSGFGAAKRAFFSCSDD